jgi:hypothetical protein
MENTLVKIESTELEKVVKESGLAIQEGEEIKQSYQPFLNQLAEIQSQASKINFETPAKIDEDIAGRLRKDTVKIRTGAEALKDSRKKVHLLKGNLEQAAYNLIAASCKITEEVFVNVEKSREFAEKKRKEILKAERIERLTIYGIQSEFYDLANMPEETFNALLDGFKKAYEDRIAAEKKAEEDRIAKEKADAEEREKQRLENIRLKKEAEEREKQAEIERQKQAKLLADQKAKADKERKELEEKAANERKEAEQKAAKLKAEQDAKLEAERKERQRLADELKSKQDAEAKEAARIESEKKAKELADKKALTAPDKEKLEQFAKMIDAMVALDLSIKSPDVMNTVTDAKGLLKKVSVFIRERSILL